MEAPVSLAAVETGAAPTLGAELERIRLQRRARQLELVLTRLRALTVTTGAHHRRGIQRAMAEFGRELEDTRDLLDRPACAPRPGCS